MPSRSRAKSQVQRLLELAEKRRLEDALRSGLARTKVAAIGPSRRRGARDRANPRRRNARESYSMKPLVTSVCELLAP